MEHEEGAPAVGGEWHGDRLRVGGFSERPAQGGGRSTYSHLPKSAFPGESSSFAAIHESVAECLADPTESGNDAQPEPIGDPETEPLPYGLCFYGPYTAGLNGFLYGFGMGALYGAMQRPECGYEGGLICW